MAWPGRPGRQIEEVGAAKVLAVRLVPHAPVSALQVEAPDRWKGTILAELERVFPPGERFNPERFGVFLRRWVHALVMSGAPLVDVRGSAFEPETGLLRVVVQEPILEHLEVKDALPAETRYLQEAARPLLGQPLRTRRLRDLIALAEQRLRLEELRYQLRPGAGGCELVLVPVRRKQQSLDVSLGYESTLGWMGGFRYGTVNFGGLGAELELVGAKNLLQTESLPGGPQALRHLSRFGSGAPDLLLRAAAPVAPELSEPRDSPSLWRRAHRRRWTSPSAPRTGSATWARGRPSWPSISGRPPSARAIPSSPKQNRVLELFAEWDNFDRHTFPRQGLLLRWRYGAGETQAPGQPFRFSYLRARGLQPLGSKDSRAELGLDLDLEWGFGKDLPLDRWWTLGGPGLPRGLQGPGDPGAQFPRRQAGRAAADGWPLRALPAGDPPL